MPSETLLKADLFDNRIHFDDAEELGYGEFHIKIDRQTGLKAIIAIHNTQRGPALGGCRLVEYPSVETAFNDALRLAIGMTYKAAINNLPLGGGKAVLLKPKVIQDREAYFKSFGQFVDSLNGTYIAAMDSGTTISDMDCIATQTQYVTNTHQKGGDPSPHTALGVCKAMETAVEFRLKKNSLKDIHVAIQGVGHVGYSLCEQLIALGAKITICDVDEKHAQDCAKKFGVDVVEPHQIYDVVCDVFSPCGLGGVLNKFTIPRLKTSIVCGAANNQLSQYDEDSTLLEKSGILYAPDYAINGGGLIFAYAQYINASLEEASKRAGNIRETLMAIFERASRENCSPAVIADKIAEERLGK